MKTVQVEYFAVLRERTGVPVETIETAAEKASDLYAELQQRHDFPELASLKVAINDEFADWDAALCNGDSVVFIPPVAGG
ncbi:MAG: MoaD/ThiS family protein [Gammaproteobacteria bacterium]|jgi:molybdopterin converting factor subunit 1